MPDFLDNLNSNVLCSIAMRTVGPDPAQHEIYEFAAIKLDKELNTEKLFHTYMKPELLPYLEKDFELKNKGKILRIAANGTCKFTAADRLLAWMDSFRLPFNKKIMPLAHNWAGMVPFLHRWLGQRTFDLLFDYQYRDIVSMATCYNDIAGWRNQQFPYPKMDLQYLCVQTRTPRISNKSSLIDAKAIAGVYRHMLTTQVL